jgi:hypothetical protein
MTEETEEQLLKGIIAKLSWQILDLQNELSTLREDCAKIAEQSVVSFGTPLQATDARDLRSLAIARRIRGIADELCDLQK